MRPRRPEVRAARARRRQANAAAEQGGSEHNTSGSGGAPAAGGGPSRTSAFATDAARLLEKMLHRSEQRQKAEERVEEREGLIKARYADTSAAAAPFDKDDLLAELIGETRSNFLKLDQELSEDHNIATRRLHAAVFAHATDFLQLFRDVSRASQLVETLKGRVQGTKAAISAISKFSTYGDGNSAISSSGGAGGVNTSTFGLSLLGSASGGRDPAAASGGALKGRSRPSLIATRLVRRQGSADDVVAQTTNSDGVQLLATTRSLNTPSVRLWRETTLRGGGSRSSSGVTASLQRHQLAWLEAEQSRGMPTSQDITVFAEVLREEVLQVIAERRFLEAAELLRGMEAEATAKGCLPLLLTLEEVLVRAIRAHLHRVPMPLMYSESLHIPLIQLLLRFGRVSSGSRTFFRLHAVWVDSEMDKLQLRIDPHSGALIASDFLVSAVQEVLKRQQNLWRSTVVAAASAGGDAAGPTEEAEGETKRTKIAERTPRGGNNNNNNKGESDGGSGKGQSAALKIPPSSAAVLWVHDRIDKLAHEVLEARALSYGTGAEGGDPSRFRRAVVMAADAIRTLRRMDEFGYAGCDTHLLRLLTPSLVYLQADFCGCTDRRLESTGRAMVEHLIRDVCHMYEGRDAAYSAGMCDAVARKNNRGCRELQERLKRLPRTSYALLLELLLAPASSRLFTPPNNTNTNTTSSNSNSNKNTVVASPPPLLLQPEQYTFLRYANGCTRVHGLLLSSVIRFVAAMTGHDALPLEHAEQQQAAAELRENQVECVSFLLSNAVVTESLDVTLQRLFLAFLRTALRQRQALVLFLRSAEFNNMHRQFLRASSDGTSSVSPSPRWVLNALQLLLADVLSASVWVAFLSRGGALSQMLRDPALAFRVQYLEELRRVLPRVVQGWMAATLAVTQNAEAARDLLVGDAALLCCEGDSITTPPPPPAAAATATAPSAASMSTAKVNGTTSAATAASSAASYVASAKGLRDAAAQLLRAGEVNEMRMVPFLFDIVRSRFIAHPAGAPAAALLCAPSPPPPSPVWCLRSVLGNYPQFPIGGTFDRNDELFLFHWCAQISLNALAFFQERLLVPSHVLNERWSSSHPTSPIPSAPAATPFPLRDCASPQEESVIAVLATGGGNYTSAVALLQFIIVRLLRDVLCRAETWDAVYGLPLEKWRQSESILREQVFFFALFVHMWSPLFVGSAKTKTASGRPAMTNRNGNVDGAPAMVILQWLTCASTTGEAQQQQQQQKPDFDAEGLAFPLNAASSTAASAAKGLGAWRSQGSNSSSGKHQQQQQQRAASDKTLSATSKSPAAAVNSNSSNSSGAGIGDPSMLLLDLIDSFFASLQEPRAMPAIISDVTRERVEKVMGAVNLADFAGKVGLSDTDEDEEDEDEEEDDGSTSSSSSSGGSPSRTRGRSSTKRATAAEKTGSSGVGPVTLLQVRAMLLHYVAPLL
ncbi:hypothetical protein DQ04_02821020 [Trypanosoma grayi]|uniref:hypothetical protein n=1 Tax=Trypanosoma grayi TaxID=71804 RepID=UPI0004F46670|nr:hypothetical protein DQ04_02821020 [Trypanosoma grayi]KEG11240.1 hypothetical protein DQ04_02821020 [Trypanosoma grayi]